jgi:hypothetical protein
VPGVLIDPAAYFPPAKDQLEGLFDYDDWLMRQRAAGALLRDGLSWLIEEVRAAARPVALVLLHRFRGLDGQHPWQRSSSGPALVAAGTWRRYWQLAQRCSRPGSGRAY